MDENQRLQLQDMIKANDTQDQTEKIRKLKHSSLIKADVQAFLQIQKKYSHSQGNEFFRKICMKQCSFLYTNYTDIYNKLTKGELNLNILSQFVDILAEIEEGKMDQHEGSFKVGTILKQMYVDSALKKSEKLDRRNKKTNKGPSQKINQGKNLTYKQYKAMNEKKI
jgi:hypothetical protein